MALTAGFNRVVSNVQVFLRGAAWAPGANPSRADGSQLLVSCLVFLGVSCMVHIYRNNVKEDDSRDAVGNVLKLVLVGVITAVAMLFDKASQEKVQELEEKRKQEKKKHEEEIRDLEEIKLNLQNEIQEKRNSLKWHEEEIRDLEEIKIILQNEIHEQRSNLKYATELDRYEKEVGGRGICFVMNNFNFPDGRERQGAEYDEKTMVDLFRNDIHFEVKVLQNLNGSEILKSAKYIAKRDFSQYAQFVFIIMSHGDKDAIEGVDGAFVKVTQLMSLFSVRECKTLRNKPKLFFIQACRGKLSDPRKDRLPTPLGSTEDDSITWMLYPDSSLADGVTPLEADFLLSFATVPGYKSWRSKVRGSWYIQVLADVIRKNRQDHDLIEMLTEVNKQVAGIANEYPESDLSFQVPAHSSTLRAKVFLS